MLTMTSNVSRYTRLLCAISLIAALVGCGNKKPDAKEQSTENPKTGNEPAQTILKEREIDGKPVEHYLDNPGINPTLLAYVHGEFQPADNPETLQLVDTLIHHDGELEPLYFSCFMQICKQADSTLADALGPYAIDMLVGKTRYAVEKLSNGTPDYFTGLIANELYKKDDWQAEFDGIKKTLDANIGTDPAQKKELDQLVQGIQNDLDHLVHKK